MFPCGLAHEEYVARGEVGKVAGPVRPRGHETGKIAEGTFAPDVQATFAGIARRKLQHRKCQGRVEAEPRSDPDDDGTRARRRGGCDPTQADSGDHVEKHQIAETKNALQLVWIFGNRSVRGADANLFGLVGLQIGWWQ